jgi:DNA-binding transcriptional regulator YiaG
VNKAYNEIYLEDAMRNLGTAFDFAKNSYNIEMDDFYQLFINSGLSEKYEKGNVKYVSGMSGIELVLEVLKNEKEYHYEKDYVQYDYSCEYWCGWILAYFQWFFGITFKELHYYLKMTDLEKLYDILHEVSEIKAIEVICRHIVNKKPQSKLQYIRQMNGLSQSELAERSSVSLRMIQQYEQRKKDINKASAFSLRSMADVLNCDIEDLMEWRFIQANRD